METEKTKIEISKNKLVLLSKLLKEVKNIYKEKDGKELLVYKYKTQRVLIETFFDDKLIDKYIDYLKNKIYKETLNEKAKKVV